LEEFLLEQGEKPLSFIGRFDKESSIFDIAKDIKKELSIDDKIQTDNIFKYWINKIEDKRIFVSRTSNIHSHLKISTKEVKGFAISSKLAPFIYVNSGDEKNAMLFTLIHELVHLWINTTGVSNINSIEFREKLNTKDYDPIEILCNQVTAEILMPEEEILNITSKYDYNDLGKIQVIARNYGEFLCSYCKID